MESYVTDRGRGLRANPWVKAAALLLAVACGVGAVFGWGYTLFNGDNIFFNRDYTDTSAWHMSINSRYYDVDELISQELKRAAGGKLSYLEERRYNELKESFRPENTNFRYTVRDNATGKLISSTCGPNSLDGVEMRHTALHAYEAEVIWGDGTAYYSEMTEVIPGDDELPAPFSSEGTVQMAIEYGVKGELTADDEFYRLRANYHPADSLWLWTAAGLTAGLLALAVFLMCCAGRRRGYPDFVLNWSDKIPYDLYLCAIATAGVWCCVPLSALEQLYFRYGSTMAEEPLIAGAAAAAAVLFVLCLAALMSTAARIKTRTLVKNTLIWRLCVWLWKQCKRIAAVWRRAVDCLFSHLPLSLEVAAGAGLYLLVNFFLTVGMVDSYRGGTFFLMAVIFNAAALTMVLRWTMAWADLRTATQAIVSGRPDTPIEVKRMKYLPSLRQHAGQLGDLGGAIDTAVKEQLKSERMKAELITNVSHDLKTPLTSIINYVDLLKKEDIENETAREYIEVLDRKSQRLKKLTEDLVEASKASTGALAVNRERLGVVQLLNQALGEYSEKFAAASLTPVVTLPEEETFVYADGRHLWRVVDNLLGNCVKYAMSGTRVYLDLRRWDGRVILSVKNVSAGQLNIPVEQLMERFVRGDESRTTEGSGLGLSIARSLTELQGGEFRLEVDGDLFKAVVAFPEAKG